MKIEIFGKNYTPSESLEKITQKKCAKLARRLKNDENASVKFNVTLENGAYSTEATLVANGVTYRAGAEGDSPFDNLDVVIPRLLGQMSKQKDIWDKAKKGAPCEQDD